MRRWGRSSGPLRTTPITATASTAAETDQASAAADSGAAVEQLLVKIVIPHTPGKLRPEVRQLGENLGATFADVSGSDMAYSELVAKVWAKGESFILLEHDVLPTPELLQEMWDCSHEWCHAFAWRYSGPLLPGESRPQRPIRDRETALFCHKFDGSLLQRMGAFPRGPVRWTQVDFLLLGWLAQNAPPHLHGPVIHLHQTHPAWAATMTEKDWARVDA